MREENIKNEIFNIYYINFAKVYEIKMMLNNKELSKIEHTTDNKIDGDASIKSKFGVNIFDIFKLGNIELGGQIRGANSQKVIETFELKVTNSIILNEVVEKCQIVNDFNNLNEGQLIKIDKVKLSLENEEELRIVKLVENGAFKNLTLPGSNGFDLNNLFNSIFKDYAYKIKGKIKEVDVNVLFKIPLTFENEFESSYSVDDLFIGEVSIIGIYKGKVKIDSLKNSFQYYQEINQNQIKNNQIEHEIIDSHSSTENKANIFNYKSSGDNIEYHYIDLLSIIQNVTIK